MFSVPWFPFPQRLRQGSQNFLIFYLWLRSTGLFASAITTCITEFHQNTLAKLPSKELNLLVQCSIWLYDDSWMIVRDKAFWLLIQIFFCRCQNLQQEDRIPVSMASINTSYMNPRTVILIGILGLEHVQFRIGFPFFASWLFWEISLY